MSYGRSWSLPSLKQSGWDPLVLRWGKGGREKGNVGRRGQDLEEGNKGESEREGHPAIIRLTSLERQPRVSPPSAQRARCLSVSPPFLWRSGRKAALGTVACAPSLCRSSRFPPFFFSDFPLSLSPHPIFSPLFFLSFIPLPIPSHLSPFACLFLLCFFSPPHYL